jgi:hypothetical protein
MREIELMIRLREEHGLYLRYHLLADVLLRVDFWVDDVLICVWFENPHYRADREGRKSKATLFFEGTRPPFTILDVKVERQGYGNFWRVSTTSSEKIAQEINRARQQGAP